MALQLNPVQLELNSIVLVQNGACSVSALNIHACVHIDSRALVGQHGFLPQDVQEDYRFMQINSFTLYKVDQKKYRRVRLSTSFSKCLHTEVAPDAVVTQAMHWIRLQ